MNLSHIMNLSHTCHALIFYSCSKSVRNGLAQLIGSIAKHELAANSWPQLLEFLQENSRNQNVLQREVRRLRTQQNSYSISHLLGTVTGQ